MMSLLFWCVISSFLILAVLYYFQSKELNKFINDLNNISFDRKLLIEKLEKSESMLEISDKKLSEYKKLYSELNAKKQSNSIEAQQILHDMTKHGQSIIKITPMCPSDIFWRSPR